MNQAELACSVTRIGLSRTLPGFEESLETHWRNSESCTAKASRAPCPMGVLKTVMSAIAGTFVGCRSFFNSGKELSPKSMTPGMSAANTPDNKCQFTKDQEQL